MTTESPHSLTTIDELPDTVLLKIFSYLPIEFLVHCASEVCLCWQKLCGDFSIWHGRQYTVSDSGLTQDDLEVARALGKCQGVRHVKFERPVKFHALKALGFDGMIETLIMCANQNLPQDGLKQILDRCPRIITLGLPCSQLKRPDCNELLSNLEYLENLIIKANNRSTVNLGALTDGCPRLSTINAAEVSFNSKSLDTFIQKRGSQLKELIVFGMTTDGDSILPLLEPCHSSLKKLCISLEKAKPKNFAKTLPQLSNFEALVELELSEVLVKSSAELIEAFSGNGLHNLQSVTLRNVYGLTGASLAAVLRNCPHLQRLDISRCRRLQDSDLITALNSTGPSPLPLLAINLSFCDDLTDVSVSEVAHRCPKLQELRLRACIIMQHDALQPLVGLPDLRVLDVSRCYNIGGWCKPLCELTQLRWLDVSYLCVDIKCLEQLVKQNKYLNYIALHFCNGFNEITLEQLLELRPQLKLSYDPEYIKESHD